MQLSFVRIINACLICTISLFCLWNAQATEPFWRKNKVFQRITDERAIVVSVRSESEAAGWNKLTMSGAGLIHVGPETAFTRAKDYPKLASISDHIREVKRIDAQTIFVHTEAFKYHARMTMRVTESGRDEKNPRIGFRVVDGHFKGMAGEFIFEPYKWNRTVMAFQATYNYKELPMPKFFVEFGIEMVLKVVAQKMRTALEKDSAL